MASKEKNLSNFNKSIKEDYSGFSFAVLVSEYHEEITSALKKGAIEVVQVVDGKMIFFFSSV